MTRPTDHWRCHSGEEINRWRKAADIADLLGYHVGVGLWWAAVMLAWMVGLWIIGGAA